MRKVLLAIPFCLVAAAARGEPFKIQIRAEVPAQERPTLTLLAAEALRDVLISLRPQAATAGEPGAESPETAPQELRGGAVPAGGKRSFPIGTGRIGRTLWTGAVRYKVGGRPGSSELRFETLVTPTLKIRYDRDHLNLKERYVELQLSQPAGRAEVRVFGEDDVEIGAGQADLRGAAPGTWLHVPWKESRAATVLRLEVVLRDRAGFPVRLTLWPWSVTVPHEEVRFSTASSDIRPEERGKLEESHKRIAAVLFKVQGKLPPAQSAGLYVAGHTDTVGGDGDNLELSQRRARAIAAYLRASGLVAPVFYAGVGERSLKVQTADNVDEERNRRADYVLAIEPPRLAGGARWQRLP